MGPASACTPSPVMLSIASLSSSSFAAPCRASIKMSALDYAKALPGTGPFGFFDPLGFMSAEGITEGKVRYFREVEVKHGRVAMLAAVGFPLAEGFHPLFGGSIDVPSYVAFQASPLQTFWPAVVATIGIFEFFSIVTIDGGFEIRSDIPGTGESRAAGDFYFDPMGLKPKDAAELMSMQEKELNNGRLAMIAIAGMVSQELATGTNLF